MDMLLASIVVVLGNLALLVRNRRRRHAEHARILARLKAYCR